MVTKKSILSLPSKIALVYLVLASLWIIFSDKVTSLLFHNLDLYVSIQQIKGIVFVALTALLMYLLIKNYTKTISNQNKSLKESEERWQFALEGAGDGVWDWNAQTNEVFYSHQWKAMLGYEDDEIGDRLQDWQALLHPEDIDKVDREIKYFLSGKTDSYESQYRLRCKDGSYKWILDRGKIISRTENGEPLRVVGTHKDINESKLFEIKLETTQFAIDNAQIGVYQIEEDGKIIYVNKHACESLGYTKDELINKPVFEIDPNFNKETFSKHRNITREQGQRTIKSTHKRKDSTEFPVEVTVNYFEFKGKRFSFSFVKDITEKEQFVNELVKAKEKAEHSDRLKTEFLAQISHEIRSPLNAIINLNSLVKEEVRQEGNKDLETAFVGIESSSRRIIRTIDLILNMSELQLGLYQSMRNLIDLSDLLKQLVVEYRSSSTKDNLVISFECNSDNTEIMIDDYAVSQMFSNILDNAIKYTEEGYVKVTLDCIDNNQYLVKIEDSGIGISKDYLPELFTPFRQEDQGYSRQYEGNGLGLALVKKYGDLVDAKIEVESEKNVGTTFNIILKR